MVLRDWTVGRSFLVTHINCTSATSPTMHESSPLVGQSVTPSSKPVVYRSLPAYVAGLFLCSLMLYAGVSTPDDLDEPAVMSSYARSHAKADPRSAGADEPVEHMTFVEKIVSPNEESFFCDNVTQYSGYLNVSSDKELFFWFFESRDEPSTDPVILWLTGGPGCSSMLALLAENGPCQIDDSSPDTTAIKPREYSWNNNANIIYIDQPAFVGYSFGATEESFDHSSKQVAQDLSHFLLGFFKRFPEYSSQPFYVFGESYGGHYVPALGNHLVMTPDRLHGAQELRDRFAGMGIGNGMVDPAIQFRYFADYALYNHYNVLAQPNVLADVRASQDKCNAAVDKCSVSAEGGGSKMDDVLNKLNLDPSTKKMLRNAIGRSNPDNEVQSCDNAFQVCASEVLMPIMANEDPKKNNYDIRQDCGAAPLCYDFSREVDFLNHPSVQARLGVMDSAVGWQTCNTSVYTHLLQDYMVDYAGMITPMLMESPSLRLLVYSGDADLMCNWMGGRAWVMDLDWPQPNTTSHNTSPAETAGTTSKPHQKPHPRGTKPTDTAPGMGKFSTVARERKWYVDGEDAGSVTGADRVAFLRLSEAGHMVPLDQPRRALHMLNRFLANEHL